MSRVNGTAYWLVPTILVWAVSLLLYILVMSAYDAVTRADTNDTFYMVIQPNKLGYDFDCLPYPPYEDQRQMATISDGALRSA